MKKKDFKNMIHSKLLALTACDVKFTFARKADKMIDELMTNKQSMTELQKINNKISFMVNNDGQFNSQAHKLF